MNRFESLGGWGRAAASGLLVALLAACSVEPTYKRPEVDTPAAFKEAPVAASGVSATSPQDTGTWKQAQPPTTRIAANGGRFSATRNSTRWKSRRLPRIRI